MLYAKLVCFVLFIATCSSVPSQLTSLFRLYNSKTGDHFYTADFNEAARATTIGYTPEGSIGKITSNSADSQCPPLAAIYRSWNGRDHFYTTSDVEAVNAASLGYTPEGITGYCAKNQGDCGATLKVHRLYIHRTGVNDHFYTTSDAEAEEVKNKPDVTYEGIMCYIWN